jgi:hypothetical protein
VLAIRVRKDHLAIGLKLFSAALLAVVASVSLRDAHISAQDFPAVIGRIEGDDLEVATTTPSGVERNAAPTVVASGSDVTLRSGHALLMLNTGGEISVCGPAHFKLIQSAGSVTLALDYGRVRPSLESSDTFTIYTPTIVATPIAIAGGMRDTTLGLDQSGEMCVLTERGALRVEPQFAEQGMIVPQGGSMSLSGGQVSSLHADASACSCDYPRAHLDAPSAAPAASAPPSHAPQVDIAALASPVAPPRRKIDNTPPPSASGKEPVYTVLMPALSFNANSPEPPPTPAPETIMLVREVRLRPLYEFRGRVNPAPEQAAPTQPQSAPPASASPNQQAPAPKPGFFDRMRNFFRSLTSNNNETSPCAGVGCPG